jgi:hypothetical protein
VQIRNLADQGLHPAKVQMAAGMGERRGAYFDDDSFCVPYLLSHPIDLQHEL